MRSFFISAIGAAVLTSFVIAIFQAHSAPSYAGEAPSWNPSDVPPWGTGPNPNGPPTNVPTAPLAPLTPLAPTIPTAPAAPILAPGVADKFTLTNADGTSTDVTDKVYLFTDRRTGAQFIVFTMPGQPPVMVRR